MSYRKNKKRLRLEDVLARTDGRQPWERLDQESDEEYKKFQYYMRSDPTANMIVSRVYNNYCKEFGKEFSQEEYHNWRIPAENFHWMARVRAYQNFLQLQFNGDSLEKVQMFSKEFSDQINAIKARALEKSRELMVVADMMIQRCKTMMTVPVMEEEVIEKDGKVTIIMKPASKNFKESDIAAIARAAAKIAETADTVFRDHFMDRERKMSPPIDLEKCDQEELRAIAAGENPTEVLKGKFDREKYRTQ